LIAVQKITGIEVPFLSGENLLILSFGDFPACMVVSVMAQMAGKWHVTHSSASRDTF
jgi:hypothetical protein